ncbi:S9 family peptidase [Salinimonas chungwhensis]|uniref:S9 family peptidase n=1 Tax=Salinimonas chungwhensis TaxID=265425 RepID=UPI000360D628|nr:prolyl oligopeptidase family serine peptidase [Salinimonas chungwhensis]
MKKLKSLLVAAAVTSALGACTSTSEQTPDTATANQSATASPAPVLTPQTETQTDANPAEITLKKIMADPQWLGRAPQQPGFSVDGSHIVYEREKIDSALMEVFAAPLTDADDASAVPMQDIHRYRFDEKVESPDGSVTAFTYKDSVFVQFNGGDTVQLTRGGAPLSHLSFMTDGRLMAQSGSSIIAIDLQTGQRTALLSWAFTEKPEAVEPPADFIAQEQVTLIDYIALQRKQRQEQEAHDKALARANQAVAPEPVHFDPAYRLVSASVSPKGNKAIVAITEDKPWRGDNDIMPHYIQEDGRIDAKEVRRRVADAKPENHQLWLVDLKTGQKQELSYVNLPGYNEDVLAEVKAENAKARGETYQVNRLPRDITLLESWYWSEPSIRWHQNGEQVAVMLEAWDNKDRWIATVDLENSELVTQRRLHDDAWINYRFNQFGWMNDSETLYFLSEESGYSHLYTQKPGEAARALTRGQFIVDKPTLTSNDQFFYYQANKEHPGIYEIYRVNIQTGESEAVTDLNGMTEYVLSPDEKTLLLTHSKVTRPPELYLKAIDDNTAARKITSTVSDAFTDMPWSVPQIVAIPSSHTAQPIYARVYLPENYKQGEPHRAVVFNHGAGYLQNAHLGWSGYFREFMFHSLLTQQGYVVLDMDYRASAGYGRDWRTAIYRNMGEPEVQDLQDGVNWLVENANVDRDRIGTYGGSYGGFLTFMSMFNAPELFKAGAALRPVTDWAHYNTPYTANILNTPDIDPIAYRRSSPIYHAEGLKYPLLINAPMVDDNVFFADTVRLVQRLIELEKEDFETAIYPVEPHGFVQPSSWLDEYRRIYKLFEENL